MGQQESQSWLSRTAKEASQQHEGGQQMKEVDCLGSREATHYDARYSR
jgi:hypothetical protein